MSEQRNFKKNKSKRVILIAYEGDNKTEKIYFKNFEGRDNDYVIRVVPGNDTDPVALVNQTIAEANRQGLDLTSDDRAYCVFDADTDSKKNVQISQAVELANKYSIIPIISTPCIELWFLLHFEYTTATFTCNEVISRLKKHYSKYEKNCNIYLDIKDKTDFAIDNCKKLEKYHKKNGKSIYRVETNPYTNLYTLVEELLK